MSETRTLPEMFGAEPAAMMQFWASFWPVAPFFGVEWRYAGYFPTIDQAMQAFGPMPLSDAKASAPASTLATPAGDGDVVDAEIVEESLPMSRPSTLLDAAPDSADDLTRIRGVGPKIAEQLHAIGIYTFGQIAGLSEPELRWVDENITGLKGMCFRSDWVGQAKTLAA